MLLRLVLGHIVGYWDELILNRVHNTVIAYCVDAVVEGLLVRALDGRPGDTAAMAEASPVCFYKAVLSHHLMKKEPHEAWVALAHVDPALHLCSTALPGQKRGLVSSESVWI